MADGARRRHGGGTGRHTGTFDRLTGCSIGYEPCSPGEVFFTDLRARVCPRAQPPSTGWTRGQEVLQRDHQGDLTAQKVRWCPEPDLNRHARVGAARFKLAVSAFHHLGWPRGSASSRPEPIGARSLNIGRVNRCCLILLIPEGASAPGTGRPHLPIALRAITARAHGMTEFHRRNKGDSPAFSPAHARRCRCQGPTSSPGMTRRSPVTLGSVAETRTQTDVNRSGCPGR